MSSTMTVEHVLPSLVGRPAPRARVERGLKRLDRLAVLLDEVVRVPGTPLKVGLDGLLGLVPGVGDGASALIQLYVVVEAARLGVPRPTLGRMVLNVLVDTLVGSIPVLGSVFDFFFKATRRNVDLAVAALRG
jgi:hypothetical protein